LTDPHITSRAASAAAEEYVPALKPRGIAIDGARRFSSGKRPPPFSVHQPHEFVTQFLCWLEGVLIIGWVSPRPISWTISAFSLTISI
jgi:hypothetical protein